MVPFLIIAHFFAFTFVNVLAETHFIFNEESGTIDAVPDSPFQLRQPHSLSDFMNQVEWVQELAQIRAFIKSKQVNIDRRYDEDDPEIEKKVRETDENCVRSEGMELQTEHFAGTYPIDLMPSQVRGEELKVQSTSDTLRVDYLKELFGKNGNIQPELEPIHNEPDCENVGTSDKELPNLAVESQLAPYLSEDQLQQLGAFLSQQLQSTDKKSRDLALYYAHFYWRQKGNATKAKKCIAILLKRQPNSFPAQLQNALVHLQSGEHTVAIQILRSINNRIEKCAQCLMPLGDAHVLNGDFPSAIEAFDKAYALDPNQEMALKKASLLRCTAKLFEVMENQHKNLLEIIKDKEAYREKMNRMQELEVLIEQNQASPEARLQAKLAYEHFEFDNLPHSYCRDGIQLTNNGAKERKRLYCTVSSWSKYEEAVAERKKERLMRKMKEAERRKKDEGKEREEKRRKKIAEQRERNKKRVAEYLDRLGPFVGMAGDEPQLKPKYPIKKKPLQTPPYRRANWPSLEECRQSYSAGMLLEKDQHRELFISPQNKGFITSEFLTKYLALEPGQITPLPWELPYCPRSQNELIDKLRFIPQLEVIKRIKSDESISSEKFAEHTLKEEFYKLVDYKPKQDKQEPLMGDLGQRIANLIKFGIGPKWMSLNLAALFFRLFGLPKEALNCLESALEYPQHLDIALTQLAQLLLRYKSALKNLKDAEGIERVLSIAMQEGIHEPIPYHLLGVFHSRQNHSVLAEKLFKQALELDSEFEPSLSELLRRKCTKRIGQKPKQLGDVLGNVCCWPNEQNIMCFGEKTKLSGRTRTRCFRLETAEEDPFRVEFVYFRCNTPYTGRSYPPPPFARLIGPLLRPAAELRQEKRRRFVQQMEEEEAARVEKAEKAIQWPVLPLDYGGYSPERIQAHLRPVWPEGVRLEDMRQTLDFGGIDEGMAEKSELNGDRKGEEEQRTKSKDREAEKEEEKRTHKEPISPRKEVSAADMAQLQSRYQVVAKLDIPLAGDRHLPTPPMHMISTGKSHSPSVERKSLAELCQSHRKAAQLLEQPVSSWVSVTAKGIKVEDLLDFDLPLAKKAIDLLEPECPDPSLALQLDSVLLELDELPAYQYRHHLTKFYKPEMALRNTLRSISANGQLDTIEQVATRLSMAIKATHNNQQVHWALSALSTLYWRVKGDPVNAIKCLRHSLYTSPDKFKDVPLISLANIYHQAGFLHSALTVGRKALDTGVELVALHFTLANIYASMGDFPHALQFYHSTLALQSNFEPAKLRILAVHCVTNGALLGVD